MFLTTENAEQYVGKTLDSTVRAWHYYPLRVVKHSNGRYYFVDRIDTMMPVPTAKDTFNAVYFDIVDGEVIDHGSPKN